MDNPIVTIRGSHITDLKDFSLSELDFPDYAAIRLAKGKYDYCGSERSLYICVVGTSSNYKKSISQTNQRGNSYICFDFGENQWNSLVFFIEKERIDMKSLLIIAYQTPGTGTFEITMK